MMPVRRYGALEMLADHLNQSRGYGLPSLGGNPEMADSLSPEMRAAIAGLFGGGGAPQQRMLPPGLPDAVQRSIQNEPYYDERGVIPRENWGNYEGFAPDRRLFEEGANQREQLNYELGMARQFPSMGMPLAEGEIAVPTDTERLRYSRPYNLGLGNLGALY